MTAAGLGAKSTRALSTAGGSKRRNIPTSKENINPNIVMQQNLMGQSTKPPQSNLLKKPKVPVYMQSLNQQEKAENFKIIDNMNKKISYKKNPRFKINKAPILFTKVRLNCIIWHRVSMGQYKIEQIHLEWNPRSCSLQTIRLMEFMKYL